jgi:hypothetical protein
VVKRSDKGPVGLTPDQAGLEALLELGEQLWQARLWEQIGWGELLRVDIPRLGFGGVAMELLGPYEDEETTSSEASPEDEQPIYGLAFYRHPLEREALFEALAQEARPERDRSEMPQSALLSLVLPEDLFEHHRAALAALDRQLPAPRVAQLEMLYADRQVGPLANEMLPLVLGAGRALLSLAKRADTLQAMADEPLREHSSVELPGIDGPLSVMLTLPYEAEPELSTALGLDDGTLDWRPQPDDDEPERWRRRDARITGAIAAMALADRPQDVAERCAELFSQLERDAALARAYLAYHAEIDGEPLVERFFGYAKAPVAGEVSVRIQQSAASLSKHDRAWIKAQRRTHVSLWEVIEVDEGVSLRLRDRLTGTRREVFDATAAEPGMVGLVVLARIVVFEKRCYLAGSHCAPLAPDDVAPIERWVLDELDRERSVASRLLLPHEIVVELLRRWDRLAAREEEELRLVDPSGEEILLTVDHYAFKARVREDIACIVLGLDEVRYYAEVEQACDVFSFVREDPRGERDPLQIGRLLLGDDKARLETETLRHADELRARLEAACGKRLEHRIREHEDPAAEVSRD